MTYSEGQQSLELDQMFGVERARRLLHLQQTSWLEPWVALYGTEVRANQQGFSRKQTKSDDALRSWPFRLHLQVLAPRNGTPSLQGAKAERRLRGGGVRPQSLSFRAVMGTVARYSCWNISGRRRWRKEHVLARKCLNFPNTDSFAEWEASLSNRLAPLLESTLWVCSVRLNDSNFEAG